MSPALLVPKDYESIILSTSAQGASTATIAEALGLSTDRARQYLFLLRRDGKVRLRRAKLGRYPSNHFVWRRVPKAERAVERIIRTRDPEEIWRRLLPRGAYA